MKYRAALPSGLYEFESAKPESQIVKALVEAYASEVTRVELKTVTLAGRDGIALEWVTVWTGGG